MLIYVTEREIEDGTRRSVTECPIALAILRQTHRVFAVTSSSTWEVPEGGPKFPLSLAAIQFIKRFDDHKSVQPIAIRLPITVKRPNK